MPTKVLTTLDSKEYTVVMKVVGFITMTSMFVKPVFIMESRSIAFTLMLATNIEKLLSTRPPLLRSYCPLNKK